MKYKITLAVSIAVILAVCALIVYVRIIHPLLNPPIDPADIPPSCVIMDSRGGCLAENDTYRFLNL